MRFQSFLRYFLLKSWFSIKRKCPLFLHAMYWVYQTCCLSQLFIKLCFLKLQVDLRKCLTQKDVARALDELRGATKIVFPAGLPPHDPVRMELDNVEDLSGTQAATEVIDPSRACLWACGKKLLSGNKLSDHLGGYSSNTTNAGFLYRQREKREPGDHLIVQSLYKSNTFCFINSHYLLFSYRPISEAFASSFRQNTHLVMRNQWKTSSASTSFHSRVVYLFRLIHL